MAKVVGAFNLSHSPFLYMPPERWNDVRARRFLRQDVPMENLAECKAKAERCNAGFATLKKKLAEANPDVIVIFGDDQLETLDWKNYPPFAVFVGEEFEGALSIVDASMGQEGAAVPAGGRSAPRASVKGHPQFAISLLSGLMNRGFDPAFFMEAPNREVGIPHAFMRPAESLTDLKTPVVPVFINCFFGPQPTAARCYEVGKATREVVDAYPGDLRVAVFGSGGLWHTPGVKDAYLDEEFDRASLRYLEKGDARGGAAFHDAYKVPAGDASQDVIGRGPLSTGMPVSGGPQLGTREYCNWVAAAAVVDGRPWTIVDYVPVYASPCGMGFAYCDGA